MDPFNPRAAHGSEFHIQNRWVAFLGAKGWHVERMVGNAYQSGIPDLLLGHKQYGTRFVDIKVYGSYSFTKAQKIKWPIWEKFGIGVWILGANSPDECTKTHMLSDYELLFQPPNFRNFWKPSWGEKPDIDAMLDDLNK